MSEAIASLTSSSRNVCEPEPDAAASGPKAAPPPPPAPKRSAVETERAYATASISRYEQHVTDVAARMGSGEELTLAFGGSVKAALLGGANSKATIKREDDGSFTVTLKFDGKFGIGAQAGIDDGTQNKPSAKASVSLSQKLEAGTKLKFATPEALADFMDAAAAASVSVANPGVASGLQQLGWLGEAGFSRLAHYVLNNTKVLNLGMVGELELSTEANIVLAKFGVSAGLRTGYQLQYDAEKHQLSVIQKSAAFGSAGASSRLAHAGVEGEAEVRQRLVFDVSAEHLKQALESESVGELVGSLAPVALLRETETKGKLKGGVGVVFAGAEHEVKEVTTEDLLSGATTRKIELATWDDAASVGLKDAKLGPLTINASVTERHVSEGATLDEARAKVAEHHALTHRIRVLRSL